MTSSNTVCAPKNAVCVDCGSSGVEILTVRRRQLCRECFVKYVSHKIQKRMGMYRSRTQVGDRRRKYLLPLSGGASSLALLHSIDSQFKRHREKWDGAANDLVVVHVTAGEGEEKVGGWREVVQSQFPDFVFLPLVTLSDLIRLDAGVERDLQAVGLTRIDGEEDVDLVARLFISTKTASARADLHQLLFKRLIVAIAKKNECEAVLWGHSDSRLAARALADVAKGRGGSIPYDAIDDTSAQGVHLEYPVRDLYKTELKQYLEFQPRSLAECIFEDEAEATAPVSIKSTSIDCLLTGYITSQGEKYPSIMANVVRTTGKLQVSTTLDGQKCKLCFMPAPTVTPTTNELCYGCNRMKLDIKI